MFGNFIILWWVWWDSFLLVEFGYMYKKGKKEGRNRVIYFIDGKDGLWWNWYKCFECCLSVIFSLCFVMGLVIMLFVFVESILFWVFLKIFVV